MRDSSCGCSASCWSSASAAAGRAVSVPQSNFQEHRQQQQQQQQTATGSNSNRARRSTGRGSHRASRGSNRASQSTSPSRPALACERRHCDVVQRRAQAAGCEDDVVGTGQGPHLSADCVHLVAHHHHLRSTACTAGAQARVRGGLWPSRQMVSTPTPPHPPTPHTTNMHPPSTPQPHPPCPRATQ